MWELGGFLGSLQSDLVSYWWRDVGEGQSQDRFLRVAELWQRLHSQPRQVSCAKGESLMEKEWDPNAFCEVILVDKLEYPGSLVLFAFAEVAPTLHFRKTESPLLEDHEAGSNIMLVLLRICLQFTSWWLVQYEDYISSRNSWVCAGETNGKSDYMGLGCQDLIFML